MTRRLVRQLQVSERDLSAAVGTMRALRPAAGWVVLRPGIRPEDEPPAASGLLGLLGGATHWVPVCTWVPAERAADEAGVQHASGTKAARRLADTPATVPAGWVLRQDHPRRGLVFDLPDGTDPEVVLRWLVAAAHQLTRIPLTGDWLVDVHLRRQPSAARR